MDGAISTLPGHLNYPNSGEKTAHDDHAPAVAFQSEENQKIFPVFLNIVTYFLSNSCSSIFCKLRHFLLQFFDLFFLLFLLKECL